MNLENKNIDLFNPFILVFMVVLFIAIALPMWYFYKNLPSPSADLFIYIALGLLFFALGIILSNFLVSKKTTSTLRADGSFLDKIYLKDNISIDFNRNPKWLLSYIIFLPFINILLAGFNRRSHYLLLFLGLLLFALTGYRTTPIAIVLSTLITLYYTRNIKFKYIIMIIGAMLVLLLAIGFIAVQAISWQHWHLNAIELVSYRAAFTLNVLEHAIRNQFSTAGNLFYSTLTGFFTHIDPRVLVGQATLARDHSITSTIFGPALLDFGAIGMVVQMFLIGFILKSLHSIQKHKKEIFTAFYGILLAQSIIWIETGPTDVVVWFFYLIGIILIAFSFYKGFMIEN